MTHKSRTGEAGSEGPRSGPIERGNAANATSIGGATLRTFRYSEDADAPSRVVLELAGLRIEPDCDGGDLDVTATATDDGSLQSASEDPANGIEVAPNAGSSVDLVPANDDNATCQFAGTAVGTG